MPQADYIITLFLCIAECLGFSGIVYGWGGLVYVLKAEGYFGDDCPVASSNTSFDVIIGDNETNGCEIGTQGECSAQNSSLGLVFTVGAFSIQGASLIWGFVYDRLGTRVTRILFSILMLTGCLLFALSTKSTSFLLYPAMVCIAAGGIAIVISNMQVSNLFGHKKSTVLAGINGCFDTSASIMLFIKLGYEGGISMQTSFYILGGCTLFFNINTFVLMPKSHIPWPLPKGYSAVRCKTLCGTDSATGVKEEEGTTSEGATNNGYVVNEKLDAEAHQNGGQKQEKKADSSQNNDNSGYIMSSMQKAEIAKNSDFPTLRSCLCSPIFVLLLMFISILQLRMLFFLGSFNPWLTNLTGCSQDSVSYYTTVFVFCQSTGIVMSPFCGLLLDRNKSNSDKGSRGPYADMEDSVLVFALTTFLYILFSIAVLIPVVEVQIISFILQVLSRSFMYSSLCSGLAIFFPMQYFGSMYGLTLGIAGVIGLLQYPIFLLWTNVFNGDPLYVNIGLLVLCLLTFALPVYIYIHAKRKSATPEIHKEKPVKA